MPLGPISTGESTFRPDPARPYGEHLNIALTAADKAAEVLLGMRDNPGILPPKPGAPGGLVVCRADHAAEQEILTVVRGHFPEGVLKGHGTLFEESALQPAARQWIADPLDGTRNYLEKKGPWGTMIAFSVEDEVKVGVIKLPEEKVTIAVRRGDGVTINGKVIAAPKIQPMAEMTVYFDTYGDRYRGEAEAHRQLYQPLVRTAIESRCSADTFYKLIRGEIGVAIEYLTTPWDDAAGSLIVEELGGYVVDFTGRPWSPRLIQNNTLREQIGVDTAHQGWGVATRGLIATFSAEMRDLFLSIVR